MRPGPAVLLTDFGLRDPYAGIVKGVILAHAPKADIVDLGHELDPQDLRGAALALRAAAPFFPERALFVVVVDPGVGSPRRILWARSRSRQYLVPDNGVLSWLDKDEAPVVWRAVRNPAWFLPAASSVFHGRDRFAPVAAALLNGVSPAALGPRIHDPVRLPWPEPKASRTGLSGEILSFDRFGNAVTSIPSSRVPSGARVFHRGRGLGPLRSFYAEVPRGRVLAVAGSSGLVELSTREGDYRARTRARPGDPVHVRHPRR